MDVLQAALIFLILLLGVFLTVLGIQVFLILRDLKKALDKLDGLLADAQILADDIGKPVKAAAEVSEAVEAGAKIVKEIAASKPARKLFFRRH